MKTPNATHHWLIVVLSIVCLCGPPAEAQSGAGTRAFEFLRLPAEPVGHSLWGAHLASVTGPASIAWNPAGLGQDDPGALLLSHATWMAETSWEWGAFTIPLSRGGGAFAFSCGIFRVGGLEGYDADGASNGTFSPLQATAALAYGRCFGERFSAGLCVETALDRDGRGGERSAWAGGGGVQLRLGRLALGAAASHLAPEMRMNDETFPLPMTARGGGSLDLWGGMRIHAAAEWVADESAKLLAGWEWEPAHGLRALAGCLHDPDAADAQLQPTYGLALAVRQLQFAYGFQPARWLEASHHLSLTMEFSGRH